MEQHSLVEVSIRVIQGYETLAKAEISRTVIDPEQIVVEVGDALSETAGHLYRAIAARKPPAPPATDPPSLALA